MPTPPSGRPWWREFWPWLLIGLIGTALLASVATVLIANRNADTPVSGSQPPLDIVPLRASAASAAAH